MKKIFFWDRDCIPFTSVFFMLLAFFAFHGQSQTVLGYVKVQGNNGPINLRVITVPDAMYAGHGVVKIKMPDGSEGAADLVPTNDAFASPVRVQTNYGTKSWRSNEAVMKQGSSEKKADKTLKPATGKSRISLFRK